MRRYRPEGSTRVLAIGDIAATSAYQVWVVDAASGVTVKLPRCEIDFRPGHVVLPDWVYRQIWLPTVGKKDKG